MRNEIKSIFNWKIKLEKFPSVDKKMAKGDSMIFTSIHFAFTPPSPQRPPQWAEEKLFIRSVN